MFSLRKPLWATLLLAACGGGGGEGGAGSNLLPAPNTDLLSSDIDATHQVDASLLASITGHAGYGALHSGIGNHTMQAAGFETAWSYGLTGSGQAIGLVGEGLLDSHGALQGADLQVISSVFASDKDTGLVGLLAAEPGASSSTQGASWGARFVFVDNAYSDPAAWASNLDLLRAESPDVSILGVQWDLGEANPLASLDAGKTLSEALHVAGSSLGYSAGAEAWQAYADSIRALNAESLLIVPMADKPQSDHASLLASAPLFDPSLETRWLSVVNVEVRGDDSLQLYSAPCGQTAMFCLGADGVDLNTAQSDGGVASTQGSILAAAQVAAAFALLSEAFPNLSDEALRFRLLASADQSAPNFDNPTLVTSTGHAISNEIRTVDLGNGVERDISSVFGAGQLDVAAALQPIGVTSTTSFSGERVQVSTASLSAPPESLALARESLGEKLQVEDALGAQFAVMTPLSTETNLSFERGALSLELATDGNFLALSYEQDAWRLGVREGVLGWRGEGAWALPASLEAGHELQRNWGLTQLAAATSLAIPLETSGALVSMTSPALLALNLGGEILLSSHVVFGFGAEQVWGDMRFLSPQTGGARVLDLAAQPSLDLSLLYVSGPLTMRLDLAHQGTVHATSASLAWRI